MVLGGLRGKVALLTKLLSKEKAPFMLLDSSTPASDAQNLLGQSKDRLRAWGIAQVVGCLPSKHEGLSSKASTGKEKKKKDLLSVAEIMVKVGNTYTLQKGVYSYLHFQ
jgi:hypothetical protein